MGIDNVSDTHGRYPWVETIGGRHTLHCIALVENMFLRDTLVDCMFTCVSTLIITENWHMIVPDLYKKIYGYKV